MAKHFNFIVTYSFSDTEIRDCFTSMLEDNCFTREPDQSTYSLDSRYNLSSRGLIGIIKEWIDDMGDFAVDDVIVLYYPSAGEEKSIIRYVFKYYYRTRSLVHLVE